MMKIYNVKNIIFDF